MAEEFICTGNWWNTLRSATNSSGFDGSILPAPVTPSALSCSAGINDLGYAWNQDDMSIQPDRYLSTENGRIVDHHHHPHPILQDEVSSKPYFHQEGLGGGDVVAMVEDVNQTNFIGVSYDNSCTSPSIYLSLLEQDLKFQQAVAGGYVGDHNPTAAAAAAAATTTTAATAVNYNTFNQLASGIEMDQTQSWPAPKFPQLFKQSSQNLLFPQPKHQHQPQQQVSQLHFSNNTAFWNAPVTDTTSTTRPPVGFFSPAVAAPNQGFSQNFQPKTAVSCAGTSNNTVKDPTSSTGKKGGSSGPAFKKPRVDTPSSLPAFKNLQVRKEKLSDRITALQQLVSPFGKTDTASVLYEAIEYIKFLHGHLDVLSTPYLKNGEKSSKDGEGGKKPDLRSVGLCLVPISVTFPVANEATSDLWTAPNFGGSYR